MDNETKAILDLILEKVTNLESGQVELKQEIQTLKQGQEDIKNHITNNNIAIGDIITKTLEGTHNKVDNIEKVTKDNLYDITILKNTK